MVQRLFSRLLLLIGRARSATAVGLGVLLSMFGSFGWSQEVELLQLEQEAFQSAVSKVAASVVQIETFGGQQQAGGELVAEGPTTGTILASDGWIVSSIFSFREQPASILVTLPDGRRTPARIVARDFSRDLTLLKVDAENLPVPEFTDKSQLQVGQWTLALGKTYDKESVSQSVGIISALGRAYDKAVQTDAKVSPVNYGGPLVDLSGRVIGILSPLSPGAFLGGDSTEIYDSGIGFAVPVQDIVQRLPKMQAGEDIHSGKLGIVPTDQNELAGPVILSGAVPGSPAAKAGVRAGDRLTKAAGQPVQLLTHLRHALGPADAGEVFSFTVDRKGQTLSFACTLTEKIPVYRRRYLGLRLRTDELADESSRLVITAVEPKSPAAQAGLKVGQQILRCEEHDNPTKEQLRQKIAVAELDQPLTFVVSPAEPNADAKAGSGDEAARDNAANQDADSITVEVLASTWPAQLPENLPQPLAETPVGDASEQPAEAGKEANSRIIELPLGDFPNKAYAVVPGQLGTRPLGLMIVFPEPGELDSAKTLEYWGEFCRQYGWIVAVVNSGNPRGWSREETELASRILGRLENAYLIDEQRTVLCGIGVGGRMALVSAVAQPERVAGVITLGTQLRSVPIQQANMPLQSLDFLLLGDNESMTALAKLLTEAGYAANAVKAETAEANNWDASLKQTMQLWLEGLGRY